MADLTDVSPSDLITSARQNLINDYIQDGTHKVNALSLDIGGTEVITSDRALQNVTFPTLNQNTTGSANSLKSNSTTGLMQVVGPSAGVTRIMTIPDSNATLLTSAAAVTVAQGGTGKDSVTPNSYLKGNGTGALVERTYAEVKSDLSLDNVTNDAQLPISGGTLTGKLTLHNAFTDNLAPINIPVVGTSDPTSLSNGDIWHRSNLLYARLNGSTRTIYHSGNLATVSQAEAEAGTATSVRAWTAQRISQAIASLGKKVHGSDTYVQFNDSGEFGSDSTFTFDKTNDVLYLNRLFVNQTSSTAEGLSVIRNMSSTDSAVSTFQCLNADDEENVMYVVGAGTGDIIFVYNMNDSNSLHLYNTLQTATKPIVYVPYAYSDVLQVGTPGSKKFVISKTGDITVLNGVTTSFPSSQGGAGTVLTNNGSGTLTWTAPSSGASMVFERKLEGDLYTTTFMPIIIPDELNTKLIKEVRISLSSLPTGASVKVDVRKNGTALTDSIFTSDTPIEIGTGQTATNGLYQVACDISGARVGTPGTTIDSARDDLASDDVLWIIVTQVGSTLAGTDLSVSVSVS